MEGLDRRGQIVQNLVLIFKPVRHLVLQLLSQSQKLGKRLLLERFDVLVLLIELPQGLVLELAEAEGLVGAFCVDLLVQFVLGVVHCLHDVLFTLDARRNLSVKSVLQLYKSKTSKRYLLVRRSCVSAMVASDSETLSLISL